MSQAPVEIGRRIRLVAMHNDPDPVAPGSTGTVRGCTRLPWSGQYQIDVEWDSGRTLHLIHPADTFEVIE